VHDIGLDHALRRLDAAAMPGQKHFVVALHQPLERGEELRHVAFGRRDHGRVPSHDVIAGEHQSFADQGKAEMVRRMSWHVQHIEREAFGLDGIAIAKPAVGHEGWIHEAVAETWRTCAARRAGRSEGPNLSAEQRLQSASAVAMIVMAMGDEDVDETLALGRGSDRLQMALVGRSRIDDRHLSTAGHISIGAEEGVRAGVVGHDAADARRNLLGHAIIDVNAAIEGKLRRHGPGLLDGLPGNPYSNGARGRWQCRLLAALTLPSLFAQNMSCGKGLA
jgi:hypothetical protein